MAAAVLRSARPLATRLAGGAATPQRAVHVEARLKELMLVLPNTAPPAGTFACGPVPRVSRPPSHSLIVRLQS